jgi:chromosome segregation protein
MQPQSRRGEKEKTDLPVLGQLARFLTIPDEYQTAVAAALGEQLATLLVADEAQLWQLVAAVEGGVTAVALDQLQPLPLVELAEEAVTDRASEVVQEELHNSSLLIHNSLVIGRASDLVQAASPARAVADLLLGNVWLVADAQAAYHLAGQLAAGGTAVALDGFVARAGGLVQTDGRSAQNNILTREQARREAQADVKRQQQAIKAAQKTLAGQQAAFQAKQEEVDTLQAEEQQLGRSLNDALAALSAAQRQVDRTQQRHAFLQQQRHSQAQEEARLQQRVTELQEAIGEHETRLVQLAAEHEAAQARLAALPVAEADQQRQSLRQDVATAQTIVAGRQAVVDSRRATLNQLDSQWQRTQQRQAAWQQQLAALSPTEVGSDSQRLQAELAQLEADLQPYQAQLAEARQGLQELEEKTAAHQRYLHDLETRHTQAQIKLSQQENQLEGLQERIKADLGIVALAYDEDQTGPTPLPFGEVVEQLPQVAELPGDIESTIHHYRGQMQRMGAINPDAPQEYEETQTRHDFLEQQVADLTQTDAQLREIIAELDELTSRAFKETVEQVNQVFGHTFTRLFGGGTAQLLLTDPDDLTVSGVDILARLPNRREQALGLLSGGERSLTAVALIFSLLKVSPTPFCVLDEVDAALDEANINRFRELLRELSLNTQFIVITHNRGTVQAAQTLYGVSMGSDSASQVISMKPEDYIKQAPLL